MNEKLKSCPFLGDYGDAEDVVVEAARYVFIFKYGSDWMISLFKGGKNYKYFNSSENDWDTSWDYADMFTENGGNRYHYEVPDYDYVENIDVFNLRDEPILELEDWRVINES
jgi:hypothetical protein